jgi:hypothetical protein
MKHARVLSLICGAVLGPFLLYTLLLYPLLWARTWMTADQLSNTAHGMAVAGVLLGFGCLLALLGRPAWLVGGVYVPVMWLLVKSAAILSYWIVFGDGP